MNSVRSKPLFGLGLLLLALIVSLSACSVDYLSGLTSPSGGDIQSQVNTAVAATLVQSLVETKVAEKLMSAGVTEVAAAAPTATPLPTDTPQPTATPPPTLPPTEQPTAAPLPTLVILPTDTAVPAAPAAAAPPRIYASVATNCRVGPSKNYRIDGYLAKGDSSIVLGRDSSWRWWYIEHPTRAGGSCWVWGETTVVEGDISSLPVVAAPDLNETTKYAWQPYSWQDGWCGYDYCGGTNWGTNWCADGYCSPYGSGYTWCDPNLYGVYICKPGARTCRLYTCGYCGFPSVTCKCKVTYDPCKPFTKNCVKAGTDLWKWCLKHPKECGWK